MVCCSKDEWYHRRCLKERAFQLEDDFVCPSCSDIDVFRENMLFNGVFIPQSNAIALYQSINDENGLDIGPPQKKRRIHKDWIFETTFKTKSEADKFLFDGNWGFLYDNKSDDGTITVTFRCKLVKFRGAQCAAGVCLVFDSRGTEIQLFRADAEHTHENNPNAVEEIPLLVQQEVKRLYENNVTKPKAMKVNLVKNGFDLPAPEKFLCWQGFPVLMVGVSDLHRSFHPVAAAVCVSETRKDFEFIFLAVQQGISNIFKASFEPMFVISDAATAIHNAARKIFGDIVNIIICWFHMRRNVADKLPSYIEDLSKQMQFLSDLDQLQVAKTVEIFEIALELFLSKWRAESQDFMDYFEREWVKKNPNWYEK